METNTEQNPRRAATKGETEKQTEMYVFVNDTLKKKH